jgi:hypothetical protein
MPRARDVLAILRISQMTGTIRLAGRNDEPLAEWSTAMGTAIEKCVVASVDVEQANGSPSHGDDQLLARAHITRTSGDVSLPSGLSQSRYQLRAVSAMTFACAIGDITPRAVTMSSSCPCG